MKTLKNRLVVVLLAACMLVTGLFAAGGTEKQKANALSPLYQGGSDTIYYFTDYYPALSEEELINEFSGYNIVLDHQCVSEQGFNDLVNSNYFTGFDAGCCVIIDIKTFMPDSLILYDLFYDLQESQGCFTIFISPYSQSDYQTEYNDIEFLTYVDRFIIDNQFMRLRSFCWDAFGNFVSGNRTLTNTTYFIDSKMLGVGTYIGVPFESLCEMSIFLRVFAEVLCTCLPRDESDDCQEIAWKLENNNIKILVPTYANYFVDLLTFTTYCYEGSFNDMIPDSGLDSDGILQPRFACAFGFTTFSQDYHNFLYQVKCGEGVDLPVYAYIVDPINYDPNGLPIITNSFLRPQGVLNEDMAAACLWDLLKDVLLVS